MSARKFLLLFGVVVCFVLIWMGKNKFKNLLLPQETTYNMESTTSKDQRFEQALSRNEVVLVSELTQRGIPKEKLQIFLRAFKAETELEVWIKTDAALQWELLKTYPFCKSSGTLGPKRKEGDLQIPEGIYHIDRFNPKSNFHLSLGLNYPNASDRLLGDPNKPGSDIFIHGGCQTVGCIPITDVGIEELYVLSTWAKENGQAEIPVYISPFRFNAMNWQQHRSAYREYINFWQQLEAIDQQFEKDKRLPEVKIGRDGTYRVDERDK